ncbi:hypothetical protein BT69DRAFT_1279554 [Atractiella rhizophila]|nr:hypothetical protein BT69DRAFT_1279554 [Atractiella rhizophila]
MYSETRSSNVTKKQLELYNRFYNKYMDKGSQRMSASEQSLETSFRRAGWKRIGWKDFGKDGSKMLDYLENLLEKIEGRV